jgi:hypothetical protein
MQDLFAKLCTSALEELFLSLRSEVLEWKIRAYFDHQLSVLVLQLQMSKMFFSSLGTSHSLENKWDALF